MIDQPGYVQAQGTVVSGASSAVSLSLRGSATIERQTSGKHGSGTVALLAVPLHRPDAETQSLSSHAMLTLAARV